MTLNEFAAEVTRELIRISEHGGPEENVKNYIRQTQRDLDHADLSPDDITKFWITVLRDFQSWRRSVLLKSQSSTALTKLIETTLTQLGGLSSTPSSGR